MIVKFLVAIIMGLALVGGYFYARKRNQQNAGELRKCFSQAKDNILSTELSLLGIAYDGNTEFEFSKAVRRIKMRSDMRIRA